MSKRTEAAQQRERAERRRRIAVAGALTVAAAAVVAVTVFLAQPGGNGGEGVRAASGLPPLEVETGVLHVHGLGVDPGDGVLYAATHSGLFRVPEQGKAARVANRAQDTMGFSIVGPGKFIGSGHPDPREDDVTPPLLGLIESDDRGETWDRIRLHGKADFHALHAAHGNVYGYDSTSQTFMVSQNRKDWDRRSQLPMADFAVDPTDPDTILATTQQGVVRSTDGGRAWTQVAGAPTLVVLAWAGQGQLYGVTPDGTVQRSPDGGVTWGKRGSVGGQPEAITVDVRDGKETLYVAATDRGIVTSADQGRTFTTRYSE
jgi:hypothetical protein